ncbi:proteasome subunit beta [Candidatus Marsarchaeota G2 archaeon BE_D]|jgi:proteasome beta subunit|uniref:Proteasome subunit beta n=4 Tax=Candidatus Marsarchaeota group 2 TaxID=2203771 RepID=A0A2R6CCY4_9ARCH|nr:MAG: proteasome subunit beta [Candidatus Marsarchaeota G2 archaeon ECH_B_2]PSN97418.1 MAG: proteasome subunit beta [Candidatus Marsarchaeota G2 archaeon ECH_B_3]PSO03582.1 MAG: proteasome subunit beta [Candidatus Marsarchaeota G2 archaeon ECH_B_1]PSO08753.1 MAG: proteasome subunit beta [Candidatus Marsarchaeota G2 archaeon BE_D]
MASNTELVIGGVTLGVRVKDGVVLASEKRVAYGYTILSKSAKKVYVLNERIGIAFTGLVGDMQTLAKRLRSLIQLYELENHTEMLVRSAAKLLGNILFESRFAPFLTQTLIAGRDSEGFHLFSLDVLGSVIEEDFTAIGSGAPIAIGILESEFKKDMSIEDGVRLARKAIMGAVSRDIGSGDGVDILIIDSASMREESQILRGLQA